MGEPGCYGTGKRNLKDDALDLNKCSTCAEIVVLAASRHYAVLQQIKNTMSCLFETFNHEAASCNSLRFCMTLLSDADSP